MTLETIFQQYAMKGIDKFCDFKTTKDSSNRTSGNLLLESVKSSFGPSKIETFTAEYHEKTFLIKMLTIKFNSVESVLILANDATESVKLRALEDTNEYKNNLFASFTHEFKTPLNCLFVMLHSLSIEASIPAFIKENYVKPAYYNSEILSNLVNAFSDYSLLLLRRLKLERKTVNLREFFQKSAEPLFYQAEKKQLKVDLQFKKGLPEEIRTDPRRLQQILFQLYSNAIKFTYKGTIIIKIKPDKITDLGIKISVQDTGIGICEKDKMKLEACLSETNTYLNFHKASTHSIGASLGLSVSQQTAKMLGLPKGKGIVFRSTFGVGSKFSFMIKINLKEFSKDNMSKVHTLSSGLMKEKTNTFNGTDDIDSPLINRVFERSICCKKPMSNTSLPDEHELAIKENYFDQKYGFSNEKLPISIKTTENIERTTDFIISSYSLCEHEPVLIVDDDEFNILALSTILQLKNVKSLSARNGQLALNLVRNECKKRGDCCKGFKIIFMDLNMPVLNGVETSLELKAAYDKKELPSMPIIACTAFESDIEKSLCFRAGMIDYTTKPLDIKRIGKLIDK